MERRQTDDNLSHECAQSDQRVVQIVAELEKAVRLRDDFLSLASHELRTPLTPLTLRLQLLGREAARHPGLPLADCVGDYVATATEQVARSTTLVVDLLDVSQMASGGLTLAFEPVDLGLVVRNVVARHRQRAERAGCSLEVDARSVVGLWDGPRLAQTVTCLLNNAIKYGPGKPISIRLREKVDAAELTVKDEGIGISPKCLSSIFGRFERAVAVQNYAGLGLGLYLCRTNVEAMGGTIVAESELGRGSTLTVDLPRSGPRA